MCHLGRCNAGPFRVIRSVLFDSCCVTSLEATPLAADPVKEWPLTRERSSREINLSRLLLILPFIPFLFEREGEKKRLGTKSSIGSLLLNSYVTSALRGQNALKRPVRATLSCH
jgi:hypothetical protein